MSDIRFGVSYVEDLKKTIAKQKAELERLRDLLNKDPNVDWQEMAKMLDDKDAEVERLREERDRLHKRVRDYETNFVLVRVREEA